uniref:ABC transporter permease n=1 Tax=Haemonchus contortus TaxID=6289 RepID=A0A7I5E6S6_HAECO
LLGADKVIITALVICAVTSTTHVTLFRRERRRLADFIVGPQTSRYLSTRFQIIENLRVLKIVMFACVIISVWVLLPSMLMVMVFYYFLPTTLTGQKLVAFVELFFSSFVAILLVGSAALLKRYTKRAHHHDRFQHENRLHYENQDFRLVTEKHFSHLKFAWG